MVSTLVSTYFGSLQLGHTIKNCIRFHTVYTKGLGIVSPHILCMIFPEKYFFCYILLTNHIALSDCL